MEKINDYLQIKDAAALVGVSSSTLRNWEKQGKLKARRNPINCYRLYRREDLETLLLTMGASAGDMDDKDQG